MVFEPQDLDFWTPLALLSVCTKFRADPTRFNLFYEGFSVHVGGRQKRQGTQIPTPRRVNKPSTLIKLTPPKPLLNVIGVVVFKRPPDLVK